MNGRAIQRPSFSDRARVARVGHGSGALRSVLQIDPAVDAGDPATSNGSTAGGIDRSTSTSGFEASRPADVLPRHDPRCRRCAAQITACAVGDFFGDRIEADRAAAVGRGERPARDRACGWQSPACRHRSCAAVAPPWRRFRRRRSAGLRLVAERHARSNCSIAADATDMRADADARFRRARSRPVRMAAVKTPRRNEPAPADCSIAPRGPGRGSRLRRAPSIPGRCTRGTGGARRHRRPIAREPSCRSSVASGSAASSIALTVWSSPARAARQYTSKRLQVESTIDSMPGGGQRRMQARRIAVRHHPAERGQAARAVAEREHPQGVECAVRSDRM